MSKISFDANRGEELMVTLLDAYRKTHGVHWYRPETHAPQHLNRPKGMNRGGLEWRRWISVAGGTDRRTVSSHHYAAHVDLYAKYPEMYAPQAAMLSPEIIEQRLREHGLSMPRQTSLFWPVFADTLQRLFQDDPLNIFRDGSIESIIKFKYHFKKENGYDPLPGYGPKIASLVAIFFEECGLIKIDDALPVDLHLQRIFISTGIVTLNEIATNEHLENPIRLFLCELCYKRGWNRVELSHALWFLGNKACSRCQHHAEMSLACSLYSECNGRASSRKYFRKGVWDPGMTSCRKGGSLMFQLEPTSPNSGQIPLFSSL